MLYKYTNHCFAAVLTNLFVDFNSYFASVEQQENPELRNKPIAVVPVMTDTTCAIAASYEAKAYGVRTGTIIADAKKMCPDLILVDAAHGMYVQYHHRLVQAVHSVLPVERVMSIDEMVCNLIGREREEQNARAIAQKIKATIAKDVGEYMKCSIGIGPNAYLSKTASDMQKPDGLVVIHKNDLPKILYTLQLNELTGIGRRMYQRLWRNGIYTVEALCNLSPLQMRDIWGGIEGERLWMNLRGDYVAPIETNKSTVGHSRVLEPALRTMHGAMAVMHRQLQKAATRLRSYGLVTGQMFISIRFKEGERYVDSIDFTPTQDIIQLTSILSKMLSNIPKFTGIPKKVSLSLNKVFDAKSTPTPMFEHTGPSREKLNNSLDKLNSKYGKNTIYVSTSSSALHSTPLRIAFNHIPDLEDAQEDEE